MIKTDKNKITLIQFILIIHGAQVGISITTLPRDLALNGGTDGWITLLLTWGLCIFLSILIIWSMRKHSEDTIYDLLRRYFGPFWGVFLQVVFTIYTGFIAILSLVSSILIVKIWILPQTNFFGFLFLFSIPLFMVTRHGVKVIGRYAEVVFYLTIGSILIFLYALNEANFLNLLPLFKDGLQPIIKGIPDVLPAFLGFELVFILYPFLINKGNAIKGIIVANSMTLVVYLFVTLQCFLYFSPYGIKNYIWPPLSLLKVIEFPLLERFEVLFLSLYILVFSTTIVPYLFATISGVSHMLNKKDPQKILGSFLVILILLSLFFQPTYEDIEKMNPILVYAFFLSTCIFPFLLYVWGGIINRRKGSS